MGNIILDSGQSNGVRQQEMVGTKEISKGRVS